MDYQKLETWMRESYDSTAEKYRSNDEQDAHGPDHKRLCQTLKNICCSFGREISVLDVGCGTGRYFHCLRNVDTLVGIDVSPGMLEAARSPVCADECTARNVRLELANAYTASFAPASFEFIFSLGVFGNGCAVTRELCDKFYGWLKPGGCLFFDTIDVSLLPFHRRAKMKLRQAVYEFLPQSVQDRWDRRAGWLPFFCTSPRKLKRLLAQANFERVEVKEQPSYLTLGRGQKLDCMAWKPL